VPADKPYVCEGCQMYARGEDSAEAALATERAARVAAEGALRDLQLRIQERALSLEGRTIQQEEIPYEDGGPDFATAAHLRFAARTLRALLDSPDAGAKGEVRCSRCHGDGYPECACKVDE
jgi:hypothetical protein